MILSIILGLFLTFFFVLALRRHRRHDQPDHTHPITLPPFLTRDYWRDRGRQDAIGWKPKPSKMDLLMWGHPR